MPANSGIERGKWNHNIGFLGVPETGKTTKAVEVVMEMGKTPAYVIAYDPGYNIPDILPQNNKPTGVIRYDTLAECKAGLSKSGKGIHSLETEQASDAVDLALEMMGDGRKQIGVKSVPAVVFIDEMVTMEDAGQYRLEDRMKQLLTRRRKFHTGIVWTCQSANLCHYAMINLATELYMFRQTGDKDLAKIESAGVPSEKIAKIRTLENYHYVYHSLKEPSKVDPGADK